MLDDFYIPFPICDKLFQLLAQLVETNPNLFGCSKVILLEMLIFSQIRYTFSGNSHYFINHQLIAWRRLLLLQLNTPHIKCLKNIIKNFKATVHSTSRGIEFETHSNAIKFIQTPFLIFRTTLKLLIGISGDINEMKLHLRYWYAHLIILYHYQRYFSERCNSFYQFVGWLKLKV